MTESISWNDDDDTDLLTLRGPDRLGVLSSTRNVVEQGEYVWINKDRIEHLASQFLDQMLRSAAQRSTNNSAPTLTWYDRYHFHDGSERTVNWLLVLDALNFCFWAEKDTPRWRIEYQGEILDGYCAEAAALTRAVEEGIPLWDAEHLSTMSSEELAHIFRGEQEIPLFEQRLHNVREVGRVLLERYEGQFSHAIEQAEGSAVKLALLLANDFPSFHDVASYRGSEVCFFKRAQICVADLYGSFGGKSWGAFNDLDQLTAFADYKLPQVLRHYGVLEYTSSLAARIDKQELLGPGSEEEVEIRAATIWACELLRQEIAQQGHKGAINWTPTSAEIDQRLWLLGQTASNMRPYHRTRTIYY